MSVWFITGASRGFGLEIALAALEQGHDVVATMRSVESADPRLSSARVIALDVTDEQSARDAVAEAVVTFGGIDVLVNNAGHGLLGPIEQTTDAEAREVYDVNVFGLLAVTRAVLPVMRSQNSGRIINIGSMGGFASFGATGVYASTKFAVESITESLGAELADTGIRVTVVEPGSFRTDFMDPSSMVTIGATPDPAYAHIWEMIRTYGESNHTQAGDPARAAQVVLQLAESPTPPVRVQLGKDAVARVERKLEQVAEELARWREVSLSTDFD